MTADLEYNDVDRAELERRAVTVAFAKDVGLRRRADRRGFVLLWPATDGKRVPVNAVHKHLRTEIEERDKYKFAKGRTPALLIARADQQAMKAAGITQDELVYVVVEGFWQTLAVASWAPPQCVVFGMQGADGINAKNARKVLGWAEGARARLIFDSDRRRNPGVAAAAERVIGHLVKAGAESVALVNVPGEGTDGADDVLARWPKAERTARLDTLLDAAEVVSSDDVDPELTKAVERERNLRAARRIVTAEETPAVEPPEVITLTQGLTIAEPEPVWRIENWQEQGHKVMLAAPAKAGKTAVVGNLVRNLADGGLFLGAARVSPVTGTVAIIDLEMGQGQLMRKLARQGIVNTDKVLPFAMRGKARGFNILDDTVRREWIERLSEHHVDYLILDCLRPLLDALGLNEHSDVGPVLVALDELCDQAGIDSALVVHHMGHVDERARGDSRLRDWPDVEWRIVRADPDNLASARYISTYGRIDHHVPETQLAYDAETEHLTIVGGSRAQEARKVAEEAVVDYLQRNPGASKSAVEAGVDATQREVRAAFRALIDAGRVVAKGGGPGTAHRLHLVGEDAEEAESAPTSSPRQTSSQRGNEVPSPPPRQTFRDDEVEGWSNDEVKSDGESNEVHPRADRESRSGPRADEVPTIPRADEVPTIPRADEAAATDRKQQPPTTLRDQLRSRACVKCGLPVESEDLAEGHGQRLHVRCVAATA